MKIRLIYIFVFLLSVTPIYSLTAPIATVPVNASTSKDTTVLYTWPGDGRFIIHISNPDNSADGMFVINVTNNSTGSCIAFNEFFTTGTVPWGSRFYHSNPTRGLTNPEYEMSLTSNITRTPPPAGTILRIRIQYPYGSLYGTGHTGMDTLFLYYNDVPMWRDTVGAVLLDSLVAGPFDVSYHNYTFSTECGTKLIAQVTSWGNAGGGDSYYVDGLGCGGTYTGSYCACEYYSFHIPTGGGTHTLTIAHEDDYWGDNTDTRAVKIYLLPLDPVIDSVWFNEETVCNDSNWVNICYSLSNCSADINVLLSSDRGLTWNVPMRTTRNSTGDFGTNISPGIHCFEWLASADFPNFESYNFAVGVTINTPHKIRKTTREDFLPGDTTRVKILSPDPDGLDNGALWLPPGRDTIYVLQVYPDGHCLDCMSSSIYNYMRSGTPPLNIKIYLKTISSFNAQATSATSSLTVQYINPSGVLQPSENKSFDYFDVTMFGVADCYGNCSGNDLTPISAQAVRLYAQRGKGIVLTHDTVGGTPTGMIHPNMNSLSDITGLLGSGAAINYFTLVKRVSTLTSDRVLNVPFVLPDNFTVANCHTPGGLTPIGGEIWYKGTNASLTADYGIYWFTYHNPSYNSYSAFFSYGHTEVAPLEWESKAMINCIYYSFMGGIGSGVYTSGRENFSGCINLSGANYSATIPTGALINVEISVDTTCGVGESWTGWFDLRLLPLSFPIDGIRYRVGFTRNLSGESPIFHWIEFSYSSIDTTIRIGPLDTRRPSVNLTCPISLIGSGNYVFQWLVNDLFFRHDAGYVDIFGCGIRQHYSISDTFFNWTIPYINCSSCTLIVAVRDSFCNWGYDTCQFSITALFPDVSVNLIRDSLICQPNGQFSPNPMNVRAILNNSGDGNADSVVVRINYPESCFTLNSGRNPITVLNISPGETDSIIWRFNVSNRCGGLTECFRVNINTFPR